jgi:hypothetical protein
MDVIYRVALPFVAADGLTNYGVSPLATDENLF